MSYVVKVMPAAQRQIKKLSRSAQEIVVKSLVELGENPRPVGSKKLSAHDIHSFRVDDYRILYRIKDEALLVLVIRVGNRKDVYKNLSVLKDTEE